MAKGRKRKFNPDIPKHIDQDKLPRGIYFDKRWLVWYTLYKDEGGNQRRKNVAGAKALLSELHKIMEKTDENSGSLQWLSDLYLASVQFKEISAATQRDYRIHSAVLCNFKTKVGKLGALKINRFSSALIQTVVDTIAKEGKPSKAVHCMQYIRRLFRWGSVRGYCSAEPVKVLEAPKQRKRRRLPKPEAMTALIQFAAARGGLGRGQSGATPAYMWAVMDLAYLMRLRGIEVITLTDDHEMKEGIRTNRRKGSRDNIVEWTPRLRAAWDFLKARRSKIWERTKFPVPIAADQRYIVVADHGGELLKTSLDTAFQRLIKMAIKEGIITAEERFGLHDLKRRGVTDTEGTKADKKEASGHIEDSMLEIYDFSLPIVKAAVQD